MKEKEADDFLVIEYTVCCEWRLTSTR